MRMEDSTNRFLDVIYGSDPKIDESSISLAGPTLTGDQRAAIISASPLFQEGSEINCEIIPTGLTLAPDTCGLSLTSPHVPEYAFDPLPAPGLCASPLSRYLSEDSRLERFFLGLPLAQDSVSFDCEHCGKKFTRASDLTKHTKYHTKPFSCLVDGCGYSFGTKKDLDRHIKSRHETKRDYYFCPRPGCERAERGLGEERGFVRQDHLQQHIRHRHKTND